MHSFGFYSSGKRKDDVIYKPSAKSISLPDAYELPAVLPVQDQGSDGACVSYTVTEMINYYNLQRGIDFNPDYTEFYDKREDTSLDGMTPREALEILKEENRIKVYARLSSLSAIKKSILSHGPALIAMIARSDDYHFWEGPQVVGGHAVSCIGYNEEGLILKNSWGYDWGDNGLTVLPYKSINKVTEAWTILS